MNTFIRSIAVEGKRVLRQPAFVAAFIVLLLAAVGLNAATNLLKLHFHKLPVPLRKELSELPERFTGNPASGEVPHWVCVTEQERLNPELEEMLGTQKFVFRDYVDANKIGPEKIAEFRPEDQGGRKLTLEQKRDLLHKLQSEGNGTRYADAVVNCAVTYYTGKADTVAHIPDRCYIANGYRPSVYTKEYWDVKTPAMEDGKIPVRFIAFEDANGSGSIPTRVAYFFHTDGRYEQDPSEVRLKLQNLRKRYVYYAKIEVMMLLADQKKCAAVMTDFLTEALPDIEQALPNRASLEALNAKPQ